MRQVDVERRVRRDARKKCAGIALLGLVAIAFFVVFVAVYGDPGGIDAGVVDVSYEWRSDGYLEVDIYDESRELGDQRRFADALVPSLFPPGTVVDVTYPKDSKFEIYNVHARSREAIAAPEEPMTMDMGRFVASMPTVGARTAHVSVRTPRVGHTLTASIPPSFNYVPAFGWSDVNGSRVPSWTVELRPEGSTVVWRVPLVFAVGVGALVAAFLVTHRAAWGRTTEAKARRSLWAILITASVGFVAADMTTLRVDELILSYHLSGWTLTATQWLPVLTYLAAGAWALFGVFASHFRDARRRVLLMQAAS